MATGDAILLAEANVPAKDITQYFGDGDMMQMLFSFIVNQNLILALAREKAEPLIQALKALPEIPEIGQWAQFIRNHDELTLDQLSDAEQDEIAAQFAPDKDKMWIFGRGIRRRFAPMVNGDQRRLQLAYSLMLTLPGTPVINYGEEIGMGDDLSLEERQPARTPMQWSSEPNAGFSTALADQLVLPVITEGEYSYKHVNVIVQRCDPKSLLNWMERAIRMRKECPEFGWGKWQIIETGNPSVLAHRCEWHKGVVIAVHNLSSEACNVSLELEDDDAQHLTDLVENQSYKVPDDDSHHLQLEGYGYRWFRVGGYHL